MGEDVTDYDLDFDLRNLWEESLEALQGMRSTSNDDLAERVLKQALSTKRRYMSVDLDKEQVQDLQDKLKVDDYKEGHEEGDAGVTSL